MIEIYYLNMLVDEDTNTTLKTTFGKSKIDDNKKKREPDECEEEEDL